MELQQLRYVLAVAETKNFTRAAQQCFVVQSALSHQIANLEHELGVQLFARTSRRVQLTAAGEAFLPAAEQSLAAANRAGVDAAAAAGRVRGQLRIGVIPTAAALDIPTVLRNFRQQHPEVRIALRVGSSDELSTRVREGDLDAAVLGLPENDHPRGVHLHELGRDRLVAVTAPLHPLAGNTETDLRQLAEETFVDFPAGTPGRAQSDQAFAAAALTRDVAFEVTAADLMARIVVQGLAIALLPSAIAAGLPELETIHVNDGPSRIEYLVWSRFNPSPATNSFLDTLGISRLGSEQ